MALKTFVKISNVNNLSDARYCSGMYVNLMGFSLEEHSEHYVSPVEFKEITDWLSGLEYVAEFSLTHPDQILQTLTTYEGFTWIQVEEKHHLQLLENSGYGLIYRFTLRSKSDWEEILSFSRSLGEQQIVLNLESDTNQELQQEEIDSLRALAKNCEVLLGFGFDSETIGELLDATGVKGISMKGGHEIRPGIKDFDELADILEALELED
ncbi:phosphoribosylanthranilate isomerase [Cyclobacterium xiamenense]|uniref:phosphoribosylanthranilate isomerase n=1 Tax=Cyclobacterium xiamenense TaxID=1297121 RepID=UPI0035CF5F03